MIKAEIKLDKDEGEFLSTLAENGWPWAFEFDDLKAGVLSEEDKAVKILQRIWLNINEEVVQ